MSVGPDDVLVLLLPDGEYEDWFVNDLVDGLAEAGLAGRAYVVVGDVKAEVVKR